MMIWISGYDDFRWERWHLLQKSKVDCHNSNGDPVSPHHFHHHAQQDLRHHTQPDLRQASSQSSSQVVSSLEDCLLFSQRPWSSLSTRLLWGKTRSWGRERKTQVTHLPQLGQILFFNSSELRPRIMKGQVKDNLRNKLISSSWNSAWMPLIITSLLFLFTFV